MPRQPAPLTKRCSKCGVEKPLEKFRPNPRGRHGRSADCRLCRAKYQRAWRRQNPERAREPCRRYRLRLARRGIRPSTSCDKAKAAARQIARFAMVLSILRRKNRCEKCGIEARHARLYKHHPDYNRPLDVVWLCGPCHGSMHQKVVD